MTVMREYAGLWRDAFVAESTAKRFEARLVIVFVHCLACITAVWVAILITLAKRVIG